MKIHSLSLILILFGTVACSDQSKSYTITNSADVSINDAQVVLSRDLIINKLDSIPDGMLPLPYLNDRAIPSQVDDLDLDGEWDELAFTINMEANEEQDITIRFVDETNYPDFDDRTNIRFGVKGESGVEEVEELTLSADELPVPLFTRFQMDGPAWENDKAAFRQYIDGRNGQDIFGKTSSSMALDTVGISENGDLEDNYHVMLPWGRDILAVGTSLGLGGIAIQRNGVPVRLGVTMDAERNNIDTTHFQLISEGPVRSIFKIDYKGWDTGAGKIDLSHQVTIWAGRYGYESQIELMNTDEADTLLIGLVNIHNDEEPELVEDSESGYNIFFTHDRQTYDKEWYLGMGLIFPNENFIDYTEAPEESSGVTNSYILRFNLEDENFLKYYVFTGWELSDKNFTNREYFRQLLHDELQAIANPVESE